MTAAQTADRLRSGTWTTPLFNRSERFINEAVCLCGFASWRPKGFVWGYDRFIGPSKTPDHVAYRAQQNRALPGDFYSRLRSSYDERFYHQEALGGYLNVFSSQAYYAFDRKAQVCNIRYNPDHPISWALDFNVIAYMFRIRARKSHGVKRKPPTLCWLARSRAREYLPA
jgi:hypothetical protein